MRICFFILNPFDFDSRARLICHDILDRGWRLDIIATTGADSSSFEGAPIHRIPQHIWPSRKRRFIEYNIRAAEIARSLDADIYHAVDLDTLWAANRAAKINNRKLLYESRELYTEQLTLNGRNLVKAGWRILESRLIHNADAVVTINSAIARELSARYSIKEPFVVLNTAAGVSNARPIDFRKECGLDSKYILIYQGILRPGQGILRAIDLIAGLPETGLVIVGDGPLRAEIEKRIDQLKIGDRTRLTGMVPPDNLMSYTMGADAGLLLMEAEALNNRLALPQKLFQYISAGIPPIVTSLPCLREIVEKDGLGLVLDEQPLDSDRQKLSEFLSFGLNGAAQRCASVKDRYSWHNEGHKLIKIYESLIK
ncbi:MAG: glycosyltransferase family 4 protein [candidate division Zixibacteria bacterium]|nr:glycosyltransferase family 4 protein [candidate division Zixibacteria bacterium]